jgi:uncharacterized protein (DUF2147 family)
MRFLKTVLAVGVLSLVSGAAFADDLPGKYKRPNGNTVQFAPCGAAFCATALTGPNAGKQVGKLTSTGKGAYKGTLADPAAGKSYTGKATLSGNTLKVSGCVLGGLFCRSENWTKL